MTRTWLCALLALAAAACAPAQARKEQTNKPAKILLIGKDRDHAFATHEYMADAELLAKCLRQTPGVEAVVSNGWPKEEEKLKDVAAIVLHTRLGGDVLLGGPHREKALEMIRNGVGLTAIHWGTGAGKAANGEAYLKALGVWFNAEGGGFSRYGVRDTMVKRADPTHPVSRGWTDFKLKDEYYIDLKEAPGARPLMAIQYDNKDYAIAWAYERPESADGRSFAFVGGHFHANFGVPQFRQAVVNGILWTAHVDVSEKGAPNTITPEDMKLTPAK